MARLSRVIRAAQKRGATVSSGKGSHKKVSVEGQGAYPLPAHKGNRTDLRRDPYLKGLCRHFGWDLDKFMDDL